MNLELKKAIDQISKDKGLDRDMLIKTLEDAVRTSVQRRFSEDMDVEVRYNDNTGDIMGDVTKRRGRVLGMEPDEDGMQTIIAEVPLAELANFTTFIRQTTQGRGWFTTEFARYETLPEMLVPAVVEQAKKLGNLDEAADD